MEYYTNDGSLRAVMTPGGTVVSKDLGMNNPDFAGFYTTLEKSIDGMVGKVSFDMPKEPFDGNKNHANIIFSARQRKP